MKHPGGSSNGVRWLPLARWVGWPDYALRTLAGLIMNESSGREKAINEAPPYCWGLTQLARGWRIGAWPIRGVHEPFNALDAETCLRKSLGIFRDQGDSFLPAWRGDPAVGW